jgi:hypothetical protein
MSRPLPVKEAHDPRVQPEDLRVNLARVATDGTSTQTEGPSGPFRYGAIGQR